MTKHLFHGSLSRLAFLICGLACISVIFLLKIAAARLWIPEFPSSISEEAFRSVSFDKSPPAPILSEPVFSPQTLHGALRDLRVDRTCPNGMSVVTPTYRGHFKSVEYLFKSFLHFVSDYISAVEHSFIVSDEAEAKELRTRLESLLNQHLQDNPTVQAETKLDNFVRILTLADVLRDLNITFDPIKLGNPRKPNHLSDQDQSRIPYQGCKKLYGALHSGCTRSLLLDSESRAIRPFLMRTAMDDFFSAPFVLVAATDSDYLNHIHESSAAVLGYRLPPTFQRTFMYNYQGIFVDTRIVAHMLDSIRAHTGQEMVHRFYGPPFKFHFAFEYVTYMMHISAHFDIFPQYRFLSAEQLLYRFVPADADAVIRSYKDEGRGQFEHLARIFQVGGGLNNPAFMQGMAEFGKFLKYRVARLDHDVGDAAAFLEWVCRTPTLTVIASTEDWLASDQRHIEQCDQAARNATY